MPSLSRRRFLSLSAMTAAAGLVTGSTAAPAIAAVRTGGSDDGAGTTHPKRQLRGVWIASVANIDWPSKPGLTADQQQAELRSLFDDAVSLRLNSIYLQVRPSADAFFRSEYEPWSQYLSGTQGIDPGYDPLAFAVAEAHKRNLELHAWMNPYRISLQGDVTKLVPTHPARLHPDWVVPYGGQLYYNPGLPEVRAFDIEVITDVVRRYDIDGIHFDDYFYPYPVAGQTFDDDAAFAAYGGGFASRDDWRRDNIDKLVGELDEAIHRVKPWVKWGISPFGIWRNAATDPRGSATNGLQSYDAIYADTYGWIKNGWLDYVAPQVYWNIGFAVAAYDVLVPWWSQVVDGTDVQLVIGQDAAKIGSSGAWLDPDEMPDHLIFNRQYPEVVGDIYFSMTPLMKNPLGFADRLTSDLYEYPALVPAMPSLPAPAPPRTALVSAKAGDGGVDLTWLADVDPATAYYAVYRFDAPPPQDESDFDDAENLLATVRDSKVFFQHWTDTTAVSGQTYTYYVTACDRLDHESRPSDPHHVRIR